GLPTAAGHFGRRASPGAGCARRGAAGRAAERAVRDQRAGTFGHPLLTPTRRRHAASAAPTWRAARLPEATAAAISQNTADAPSVAPAMPKASGIVALEKLIAIERSAIASPWRATGVIWCSVAITIGCTAPSARPRTTVQPPITHDDRASG